MKKLIPFIVLIAISFQCSSDQEKLVKQESASNHDENKYATINEQSVSGTTTVSHAGIALPQEIVSTPSLTFSDEKKTELMSRLSISKLFSDNIAFTENKGQLKAIYNLSLNGIDDIQFYTKGFGGTAYFSPQGIAIGFIKGRLDLACEMEKVENPANLKMKKNNRRYESTGFTIFFEGHNKNVKLEGLSPKDNKINYFRGNDASKFITDIANYNEIFYKELYHNIDLKYYLKDRQMQYDYIVKPGANVKDIALHYSGVKSLNINTEGELEIETDWGILKDKKLYSYQVIDGKKHTVKVNYKIYDTDKIGFEVCGSYNKKYSLIIDPPSMTWSTFLGGNDPAGNGYIHDIAMDAAGNVYGTGWYNDKFPMNSAFDNVFGADEQVVFKLNAAGTTLLYSSFIGGGNMDYGFGIDVDASSCAYVTGNTNSTDFPTVGAIRAANSGGSSDITISKINAAGNALVYSTYYGGTGDDRGWALSLNTSGEAYIVGSTTSTTTISSGGAYQAAHGGGTYDAFVLKVNAAGSAVQYCSYYGGTGDDLARDIDVSGAGVAYFVGATTSTASIASAGSFDAIYGGGTADGFIAVLNNTGNARTYGAYAGGIAEDKVEAIALKGNGEAVMFGYTRSYSGAGGFPSVNAYQANNGAAAGGPRDAFMMRVNTTGSALLNSTFFGTAGEDAGRNPTPFDMNTQHKSGGITVNANGDIAMAMSTDASTFPTVSSVDASYNGDGGSLGGLGDVYIAIFDPTGLTLSFTTYLGGTNHDYSTAGLHFDPSNPLCIVVGGANHSSDFPTTGGSYLTVRGANTTNDQGFVTKYCNVVLPVELLRFTAKLTPTGDVITEWATATEKDNDYFLVERSEDGKHFETIGRVKGAGNSNQVLSYSFIDENPLTGANYYRLVQVDYDGASNTSQVVLVSITSLYQITISPNPTSGVFTLTNKFGAAETLELSLVDAVGKELMSFKEQASAGLFQKTIDISHFSDGLYVLLVKTKTESAALKLIKK